jgi:hypothetical protein
MMSGLRELQCGIGQAVLGHDQASILKAIAGDGIAPSARLQIYRHHYETSLTEALKAIYPVVCRLVDDRFFGYAAHEYIKVSPPRRVCLHEYGEGFPAFLAAFPPCIGLPYLADVARLEQDINAVLHSPASVAMGSDELKNIALGDYGRLVFAFSPALRYLDSPWPVDHIWLANQPGADAAVDLQEGGCRLEIRQRGEEVVFARLEEPEMALRRALASGAPLAEAAAAALAVEPLFDLAMALRRLLADGLVTGFLLTSDDPSQPPKPI